MAHNFQENEEKEDVKRSWKLKGKDSIGGAFDLLDRHKPRRKEGYLEKKVKFMPTNGNWDSRYVTLENK
jgi:hypothetical protein